MAKSALAFAALSALTAAPATAAPTPSLATPPFSTAASRVHTLTPPKVHAPSGKALAYNYAALFTGDKLGAAFNEDLVKQATNGRVSAQFAMLAGADFGMPVPVSKADFEVWSRLILQDHVAPFRHMKKSLAYADALECIRDCMGLDTVKRGAWPVRAKATKKAEKPAYVMTPAAQAIVAKVRDSGLSRADLTALVAAIKAQIV